MATEADQWAAAGTALLQQDQAERIKASVSVALPGNPDQEAELRRVSAAARVPIETARAMPDVVKRQAQLSQFDARTLAQKFPATGAWISVPDNARIAVDDVHQLTQVEQAVRAMAEPGLPRAEERSMLDRLGSSDFWVGAAKYMVSANEDRNNLMSDIKGAALTVSGKIGQAGALSIAGAYTLTDALGLTSGAAKETALGWAKMYGDQVDAESEVPKQFHNELIRSAAGLGLQLPMILATGGQSVAPQATASIAETLALASVQGAKGMAVPAVTDAIQTMRTVYAQTGDMGAATRAGQAQYALSTAGGVLPLSAPGTALQRLLGGGAVGAVQGEVTRQALNVAMPDGMETPFRIEDVMLNAITSSLMAGAMGPRAEPQRAAAVRAFNDAYEVARAEQASEQITGLAQVAAASKLRERDPLAFKQLVGEMADRGDLPSVLHVDAGRLEEVLAQHSITGDELAQTMPRVAQQLQQLREAGGPRNVPVEIPVEDFATHIAGSELEKPMLAQLRVTPEGRTAAEAQSFRQEQQADMQARAEKLTEQHAQDTAYQQSLDKMNSQVDAQLAGLQIRRDQFDANTALLRAFYQVQADRIGLMPHEFAERYPLHGTNRAVAGFEQASKTLEEVRQAWDAEGISHALSERDGVITVSRIVVPDGKRGQGAGTAAMRALLAYADVTGQHVALTPSGDFGGNKSRLLKFYKSFGFVENKGRNRAFTTSESMYRQATGKVLEQAAYHGTPHRGIEKFSTDKMGTGEGAQAYGWGLYFAGKKEVAEWYREKLSGSADQSPRRFFKGQEYQPGTGGYFAGRLLESSTLAKTRKELTGWIAEAETWSEKRKADKGEQDSLRVWREALAVLKEATSKKDFDTKPARGQLYEVDIPEDHQMLHWDKPLSEQPEAVRDALQIPLSDPLEVRKSGKVWEVVNAKTGDVLSTNWANKADAERMASGHSEAWANQTGAAYYKHLSEMDGGDKAASEALAAAGIKGIKYLDGVSRSNGEGTHNYVVFSGDDVAIMDQFYQAPNGWGAINTGAADSPDPLKPGAGSRGTYSPSTKTIALLKGANLSTFQHELGHFFLDTMTHLAATIEGAQRGGAGMSVGEQAVLDDAYTLLRWGGVEDLTDWHARGVDEQRELHEKFATAWETYLMEGKAPSLELRSLFARFRAWMISVYKTLKGAPGEFTPEVRGVMDRMIASEDAIREAEAARKYMPLFDDPAKAGMSAEEWAAYQEQGKDATELAIEQLTGKTLRDMARIDRLRAESLKAVQKDAAGKFKEIEREVRAEVMSQPVYRAWAFLTGRGDAEQRATEDRAKASKEVDPGTDSLLVAIAKLGGLDREAARKDLGVHQDYHKTPSGIFGKPVFRKSGGLSAERMAEALAEHYYLPPDYSLHHLEDKINEELSGTPQFSWHKEMGEQPSASLDPEQITHGKLRTDDLRAMFGEKDDAAWRRLSDLGMTSDKSGVSPDIVAELFGFDSGHALALELAKVDHPREVVRGIAEQRMLERHGEIATPQDMAREADMAVANDVRAIVLARELKAVKQAVGGAREIAKAAKEVAQQMVDGQKVKDLREGRYNAASTRSAREAEKAMTKGDTEGAAMAKRDQLLNLELARSSRDAREWVKSAAEYLRKFDSDAIRKTVDPDYVDQIDALLERFDLRAATTGKEIAQRKSLAEWLKAQQALGLEPDLPPQVVNEALRTSYKDLTLAELKGLVDSVKQIEHLGRLKSKLLTAVDQRSYEAVRDSMAESINQNAGGRAASIRTPTTNRGLTLKALREFGAAHIKAATWARILDGGKDGGAVWEYIIRPANAAGDKEVRMRAEATAALHEIMAPLLKGGRMGGKGLEFPSIGRPLNRQERIAIALNTGNEGNLQRLLGGEGWTREQIQPVLDSITPEEARAVQAIWDHFETYRPLVGEMERRIYGKEPEWVQPSPVKMGGEELRGGYYPIKYDPAASVRAEEHADAEGAKRQLQGAYGAATVRRSFAKTRAEEVTGRPLLYSLAGVYQGVNETIHALSWSEWLIDANRLLKSTAIDRAVREHYGPEAMRQFKTWRDAVAEGEQAVNGALDKALGAVRQSVSVAGLGFNVMSAAMQPLGFSQSVVRLGAKWAGVGLKRYLASPAEAAKQANELSDFMASRSRTRFRELNELRNRVQEQSAARTAMQESAYYLMMKAQRMVDVPTWWGGYEKAIAEGSDEARAVALADQAVIDSQGGGQTKDLSAIEMGGQAQRLFTVFYSFMNTALNLGAASTMTASSRGRMAADYLLLYAVPAVLGALWKDALTPGDSGDYDNPEEATKKLAGEQVGFLAGLMVVVREFGEASKAALGLSDRPRDYTGPAGVRIVNDALMAAKQAQQGEFDDSFRKAAVNLLGDVAGIPSAQINRTVTGAQALRDGKTMNPAALALGYQEPR